MLCAMSEPVDAARAGMDPERLVKVIELFRRQQAGGVFPGGQLVVRRRGVLAVDEAVGIARGFRDGEGEPKRAFTSEQRSCVFSAGKPLVAIGLALLEQRRAIDVERPVAAYWPEFARQGKSAITLLDILLHRSGYIFERSRPTGVATLTGSSLSRVSRGTRPHFLAARWRINPWVSGGSSAR
jgi:CubicO group peptidase (beta-lactamase class C family)